MSLRILHVAPYSPDAWAYGGIPRVVSGLTRGLAGRGHRVVLCSTDVHDSASRTPGSLGRVLARHASRRVDGVEWHLFPNLSNRVAYHFQLFAPIGLRAFLHHHAREFDVAHLHACHNVPGVIAAYALRKAGVPYVLSPNGTAPVYERRLWAKHAFARMGGDAVTAHACRIVAVSAAEERQLLALGVTAARIRRLPNPLDLREFSPALDGVGFRRRLGVGEAPLVVFVGKITPRKHVPSLVAAFSSLAGSDARLVVAGNDLGGLSPALAIARARGIRDRIHVTGLLRGRERLEAMAAADVVVYASSDEVFGLVACEALLAGTPVIVGADSGCAEVVRSGGGGVAVRPGDARELARAIMLILRGPEHWRTAAANAGHRIRSMFGEHTVAAQLESIYGELLGRAAQVPA
jgi:glycosyltransferase involved in cell wall biosynthesis